MQAEQTRILCVDDEQKVLDGLQRNLRRAYAVEVALGSPAGLEAIENRGPFAVVVSDLRMPEMDGLTFLGRVREIAPNTTRILLTGNADLTSAIEAVNQGSVYHFLQKPCPKEVLLSALERASEHHRLVIGQRELLEKTLFGAIQTLSETLALANPSLFGNAQRVAERARAAAERAKAAEPWKVELAALLAQAAYVTLPEGLLDRLASGDPVSTEEEAMVSRLPDVSSRLLAHIPRIEEIQDWITQQGRPWGIPEEGVDPGRSLEASLLRIALDAGILERAGMPPDVVAATLRQEAMRYGERVVEAFCGAADSETELEVREVGVREIVRGMVLLAPVEDLTGRMLLKGGQAVSDSMKERLLNFARNGNLKEPLKVGVPRRA